MTLLVRSRPVSYTSGHDEQITFELQGFSPDARLIVFDLLGKVRKEVELNGNDKLTISVDDLEPNVYIYHIIDDGRVSNGQFSINR